jgi:hypothetical protein
MRSRVLVAATIVTAIARPACAQARTTIDTAAACAKAKDASTDHAAMNHSMHAVLAACTGPLPTAAGQAAFGAISEIVALLKADPQTDWSRVNIEALRQHLIDMDDVMVHASVTQRTTAGGIVMDVAGTGRTIAAIRRMAVNHARSLDGSAEYSTTSSETATGARITVTSKNPSNTKLVMQIRGLGFAGLMTEGNHHAAHHLALARGDDVHGR